MPGKIADLTSKAEQVLWFATTFGIEQRHTATGERKLYS